MTLYREAEFSALFSNYKDGIMIRKTLIKMGHPQPATPVQTNNSFSEGFRNRQVKQRRSKATDMRFYWIEDRVKQGQFCIYWKKASKIWLIIFNKHHNARHHRHMQENYLHNLHRANFAHHADIANFVN